MGFYPWGVFFHAGAGIWQHETTGKKKRALIKQAEQGWEDTKVINCHFI